jgi:hypothetical protein
MLPSDEEDLRFKFKQANEQWQTAINNFNIYLRYGSMDRETCGKMLLQVQYLGMAAMQAGLAFGASSHDPVTRRSKPIKVTLSP